MELRIRDAYRFLLSAALNFSGPWWVVKDGPIWEIHPDGSGLRQVFADPKGLSAVTPTWSPDGQLIAFGVSPTDPDVPDSVSLDVIRKDGTGPTKVLDTPDAKKEFDWVSG